MESNTNNKIYSVNEIDYKQGSFILICSKRASGKSVMVKDLTKNLLDKYEFDFIVLFSDTAKFTFDYNFVGDEFIFTTDQIEEKLNKILKIQEKNIKNKKNINGLIILDDIKLDRKAPKALTSLSSMGRHFHLTCIMSTQFPKMVVGTIIRNNLDYIIFSDMGILSLKTIYDCIHTGYSFNEFKDYVDNNNHSYQFILYDSRTQNRNERLKIIKAKEYNSLKLKN